MNCSGYSIISQPSMSILSPLQKREEQGQLKNENRKLHKPYRPYHENPNLTSSGLMCGSPPLFWGGLGRGKGSQKRRSKNQHKMSRQTHLTSKKSSPSLALPEMGRGLHPHCHSLLDLTSAYKIEGYHLCIDMPNGKGIHAQACTR